MEIVGRDLTVGQAIRVLRRSAGLTQRQLADRIGADPTYVSHLEADRREPSLSLLRSAARALEVPPGLLLAVALWADLPKEEKDRYANVIRDLIETAEAAQFILFNRRHQEDDAD